MSPVIKEKIDRYIANLTGFDERGEDPVEASIYLSLERLVDSVPDPNLARTLLQMISLLDQKYITGDILTSMAEVIIVEANGNVS